MRVGAQLKLNKGITLAEVLVAAALSVVVVMGIVAMDISRGDLHTQGRANTGAGFPSRTEAAMVTRQIKHLIENSDRIRLIQGNTGIQIRVFNMTVDAGPGMKCTGLLLNEIPHPSCFDIGANYRWDQFSMNSGNIVYFRNISPNCPAGRDVVASEGGNGVSMNFQVDPNITNLVRYTVSWSNPNNNADVMNFRGDATLRLRSVGADPGPSGTPAICN